MPQAARVIHPSPDVKRGVEYWEGVAPTVDGVLGGFGHVSRIDALGSRTFLLKVLPRLSYCAPASINTSPFAWKQDKVAARGGKGKARTRALDCGAGVGRVTENSLLPIVDEVHMVEPVPKFLAEAKKNSPKWLPLATPPSQSPFQARKAAHFHCSTLQDIDPARPYSSAQKGKGKEFDPTVSVDDQNEGGPATGSADSAAEATSSTGDDHEAGSKHEPLKYDVVWNQWCLQHLSDKDLVAFLKRSRQALKDGQGEEGIIVVKENVCQEAADGNETVWYDDEDHSITRSTKAYERVFAEAGLKVIKCEVQQGLPQELFTVKM
ncbi:related to TAE1 - AdoMet-dependent proline methyltransferase [Pseudozyma flocculosa]|uniref:Alpha N-terminal protein methyltransferase 1 n=2 Tax=Pseudozyma flocculosa TaxID=84751 RepID=A0A5C3EZ92_9BASI|nr:related to TAE1 - AdoMet-dependent proline methyltransferase [Pseudozyma flocculosa]